mmetsp:Transcript_23344/g.48984  ORF Transcript_23344/g.48984 Transcript_23344/m.48984 type:complete len:465 (-) Transcript_23344:69-1463(-)
MDDTPSVEAVPANIFRRSTALMSGSQRNDCGTINHKQIEVCSTYDADLVLRKIMEDRTSILSLRGKIAKNETELMEAKVWQLQAKKSLENHDQNIQRLISKAKSDIAGYNESSKQYIRGFMSAFESGDIEKLPRHPFLPNLYELEDAISKRKVALIEKIQADNRVQKHEHIKSQNRITKSALKKNEETFLRAISLAKQQFSASCGSWLNEVNRLLSDISPQSNYENDMSGSPVNNVDASMNFNEQNGSRMPQQQNLCEKRRAESESESCFLHQKCVGVAQRSEPQTKKPHTEKNNSNPSNIDDANTSSDALQNSKDVALPANSLQNNAPQDEKHLSPENAKPLQMISSSSSKPRFISHAQMAKLIESNNIEVIEFNRGRCQERNAPVNMNPSEATSMASSSAPYFNDNSTLPPVIKHISDRESYENHEKSLIHSKSSSCQSNNCNQADEASVAEVLTRLGSEAQ